MWKIAENSLFLDEESFEVDMESLQISNFHVHPVIKKSTFSFTPDFINNIRA